ncbi:MAG TPA: glucose-6-phosphate isomerase [Casimicrobiaceae bacterium]|nr:glucose-6-phosphate isomerase [Casimicrobiaceae bacterium]
MQNLMHADIHPESAELHEAARRLRSARLVDLFAQDPDRAPALTFAWGGWHVDISKERLDASTLAQLLHFAAQANLGHWIAALFAGEKLNLSEQRPALHPALRAPDADSIVVDGVDVMAEIRGTRERMAALTAAVRARQRLGATGKALARVVNIGIGGSDLGPRLCCDALAEPGETATGSPEVAFVSNVDPAHMARTLATSDAATTLFIVTSKTFTTQETLANAQSAREWLARELGAGRDLAPHFVAVTTNIGAARAFGMREDDIFPMAEGVGGRYSLWSAVGLSIALRLGWPRFAEMLEGARAMDLHFRREPFARNLPVILGLLAYWNTRWLGHPQRLVVPYAQALARLPAYLQQLQLESNGKSVTRDGAPLRGASAAAVWGDVGTDSQHEFFQWLHQGMREVPVEFIVPVRARHPLRDQQQMLVANALAQAQALLVGRHDDALRAELAAQGYAGVGLEAAIAARRCPGDRASTTMLLPELDARNLGALLALYEHRTFVEAILYGINPFDQWGVELGKTLAKPVAAALAGDAHAVDGADASTRLLIERAHALAAGKD